MTKNIAANFTGRGTACRAQSPRRTSDTSHPQSDTSFPRWRESRKNTPHKQMPRGFTLPTTVILTTLLAIAALIPARALAQEPPVGSATGAETSPAPAAATEPAITIHETATLTFSATAPKQIPAAAATGAKMSPGKAVILGLTEGITEYLPVSSTGHLYVVARLLGIYKDENDKQAADAYEICIQFGAILAVLVLFLPSFISMIKGLLGQDKAGKLMAVNVVAAFIPAAVMGVLLEKHIKQILFGLWPITIAWFAGGILILAFSKKRISISKTEHQLAELQPKQAFLIGVLQCLALWPGVSRSLVTIIGGVFVGMTLAAAVEFSFLLGFVTLTAATSYEFLKEGKLIIHAFGVAAPLIGLIVSFLSATAAVKWLVSYLNTHGLALFGYYRIILAILVAALIFSGRIF